MLYFALDHLAHGDLRRNQQQWTLRGTEARYSSNLAQMPDDVFQTVVSDLPPPYPADGLTRAILLIAEIRDMEEKLANLRGKLADTLWPARADLDGELVLHGSRSEH